MVRFTHAKIWLVEKEWDKEYGDFALDNTDKIGNRKDREKFVVWGTNTKELADQYVIDKNKECLSCPERKRRHAVYRLISDKPVECRMRYEQ